MLGTKVNLMVQLSLVLALDSMSQEPFYLMEVGVDERSLRRPGGEKSAERTGL